MKKAMGSTERNAITYLLETLKIYKQLSQRFHSKLDNDYAINTEEFKSVTCYDGADPYGVEDYLFSICSLIGENVFIDIVDEEGKEVDDSDEGSAYYIQILNDEIKNKLAEHSKDPYVIKNLKRISEDYLYTDIDEDGQIIMQLDFYRIFGADYFPELIKVIDYCTL